MILATRLPPGLPAAVSTALPQARSAAAPGLPIAAWLFTHAPTPHRPVALPLAPHISGTEATALATGRPSATRTAPFPITKPAPHLPELRQLAGVVHLSAAPRSRTDVPRVRASATKPQFAPAAKFRLPAVARGPLGALVSREGAPGRIRLPEGQPIEQQPPAGRGPLRLPRSFEWTRPPVTSPAVLLVERQKLHALAHLPLGQTTWVQLPLAAPSEQAPRLAHFETPVKGARFRELVSRLPALRSSTQPHLSAEPPRPSILRMKSQSAPRPGFLPHAAACPVSSQLLPGRWLGSGSPLPVPLEGPRQVPVAPREQAGMPVPPGGIVAFDKRARVSTLARYGLLPLGPSATVPILTLPALTSFPDLARLQFPPSSPALVGTSRLYRIQELTLHRAGFHPEPAFLEARTPSWARHVAPAIGFPRRAHTVPQWAGVLHPCWLASTPHTALALPVCGDPSQALRASIQTVPLATATALTRLPAAHKLAVPILLPSPVFPLRREAENAGALPRSASWHVLGRTSAGIGALWSQLPPVRWVSGASLRALQTPRLRPDGTGQPLAREAAFKPASPAYPAPVEPVRRGPFRSALHTPLPQPPPLEPGLPAAAHRPGQEGAGVAATSPPATCLPAASTTINPASLRPLALLSVAPHRGPAPRRATALLPPGIP